MRTKAHIRYKLKDGTIVPGVTTITGLRHKPALIPWANRLGLQGIDTGKYVDDKAAIGTLAHAMITDSLQGITTNTSDYTQNQINSAENSYLSYLEWANGKTIEPLEIERPMVSEGCRFGGTPDIYARVNGRLELIDLKTGSGIYPEYWHQVAAYRYLLTKRGHQVDVCRILNIPRSEDEQFLESVKANTDLHWAWFLHMLQVYQVEQQIKHKTTKEEAS